MAPATSGAYGIYRPKFGVLTNGEELYVSHATNLKEELLKLVSDSALMRRINSSRGPTYWDYQEYKPGRETSEEIATRWKELYRPVMQPPEVRARTWIRFGYGGPLGEGQEGYALRKYSALILDVGYYQNRQKAIGEPVIWTGERWEFLNLGLGGRYLSGHEERIVKLGLTLA